MLKEVIIKKITLPHYTIQDMIIKRCFAFDLLGNIHKSSPDKQYTTHFQINMETPYCQTFSNKHNFDIGEGDQTNFKNVLKYQISPNLKVWTNVIVSEIEINLSGELETISRNIRFILKLARHQPYTHRRENKSIFIGLIMRLQILSLCFDMWTFKYYIKLID